MDKSQNPPAASASRLTKEQAAALAARAIADQKSGHDFVILDDKTLEKPFGWVFFYTTRRHRETRDPRHAVPGTGPIVVVADTAQVEFLATSGPPSATIAAWEKKWAEQRGK